jgi:hypothetical protein
MEVGVAARLASSSWQLLLHRHPPPPAIHTRPIHACMLHAKGVMKGRLIMPLACNDVMFFKVWL